MNHYLSFDWGGTSLKYAYMNAQSEIIEKGKVPTPESTITKEEFYTLLDEIVKKYPEIQGIAISSPGIIDSTKGIIHVVGVFPYLSGFCLCEEMEKRYGVPVSIENDAKSAALAEVWKGNLSACSDGVVFIIGTSIGGGIVLNHQLRRGLDFFAGEFSSMNINLNEPSSRNSYMARLGYGELCTLVQKAMHLDNSIDGEQAFAYINEGDVNALHALKQYTDELALQLFNLNVLLDVEKICIGGGISQQPILLEYIRQSIEDIRTYHPDIVGGIALPLPVVDVCRFHNDANLIGALYHWFELYE